MKFSNKSIQICKKTLLLLLFTSVSFAQQISLKDSETDEVLPDVAVFNESKDKSIISDVNGNVDLELFSNEKKIFFQLLGYSLLELYIDDIQDGTLDIFIYYLPDMNSNQNDGGTWSIATIFFRAKSGGEVELRYGTETKLRDANNNPVIIRDLGTGWVNIE